jgi:hypothetical protein
MLYKYGGVALYLAALQSCRVGASRSVLSVWVWNSNGRGVDGTVGVWYGVNVVNVVVVMWCIV